MLARRRERILVGVVGVLLGALALHRLAIQPLWGYFGGIDERTAHLRERIASDQAVLAAHADVAGRLQALREEVPAAGRAMRNRFQEHVQGLIHPYVEWSFQDGAARPVTPGSRWQRVGLDLTLTGRLGPLGATLFQMDRSERPLRIERLEIDNPSIDDPTVRVSMTVSTLARSPEGS